LEEWLELEDVSSEAGWEIEDDSSEAGWETEDVTTSESSDDEA
jgi:hypothetical protein